MKTNDDKIREAFEVVKGYVAMPVDDDVMDAVKVIEEGYKKAQAESQSEIDEILKDIEAFNHVRPDIDMLAYLNALGKLLSHLPTTTTQKKDG
jgi:hypothetical protein